MNLINAFLWVTAASYYFYAILPEKPVANIGQIQRLINVFLGLLLTLNLIFDFPIWSIMSAVWVMATAGSYFDYVQWGKQLSKPRQIFMAAWDLLIAIACLMKVP